MQPGSRVERAGKLATNTKIHKYINANKNTQIPIQMHKYANIQIHKYTNAQVHKYTNTNIDLRKYIF